MKTCLITIVFLFFTFLRTANADEKLIFYTECTDGQECMDLVLPNGEKKPVKINPVLELSKKNILSVNAHSLSMKNYLLGIELDKSSADKVSIINRENTSKRLIAIYNYKIIGSGYILDRTTSRIKGNLILSVGPVTGILSEPAWKAAPFIKDFIEESNLKRGRAVKNYHKIFIAIFILAWVYVLFPRIKKQHSAQT